MKTVLFVPGYPENIESRDYRSVIRAIECKGHRVVFIPIHWARTTIVDWVKELDKHYAKYDPKNTILAGFSYGAMTAFICATKRTPSQLWLFSLSPYFAEDIKSKYMRSTWLKEIGHRRVTEFSKLDFKTLAKDITCKTLLYAGRLEIDKWPVLDGRIEDAHKQIRNSRLTIVEDVGHDVANINYIRAIADNTRVQPHCR